MLPNNHMIRIINWNKKTVITTESEIIEALKDILNNNSTDYSYNRSMALRTKEYFNIKL
jgi:hypothetical protein